MLQRAARLEVGADVEERMTEEPRRLSALFQERPSDGLAAQHVGLEFAERDLVAYRSSNARDPSMEARFA
jgi:hypothetical protein